MEQAQIAREIAKGNGPSTHSIRPLAIWQMSKNGKEIPQSRVSRYVSWPAESPSTVCRSWRVKKFWTMSKDTLVNVRIVRLPACRSPFSSFR